MHSNSKDIQALRLLLPIFLISYIPRTKRKDSISLCSAAGASPAHLLAHRRYLFKNIYSSAEGINITTSPFSVQASLQVTTGLNGTQEQSPARPRAPRALALWDQHPSNTISITNPFHARKQLGIQISSFLARPLPAILPMRCKTSTHKSLSQSFAKEILPKSLTRVHGFYYTVLDYKKIHYSDPVCLRNRINHPKSVSKIQLFSSENCQIESTSRPPPNGYFNA